MFEKLKAKLARSRLLEEQLYQEVVQELNENKRRDGLWAKALADSNGSEEIAKSKYIKLRVQSMKDEAEVIQDDMRKEEERVFEAHLSGMEERELAAIDFLKQKGFRVKVKSGRWFVKSPYGTKKILYSVDELVEFSKNKEDWIS